MYVTIPLNNEACHAFTSVRCFIRIRFICYLLFVVSLVDNSLAMLPLEMAKTNDVDWLVLLVTVHLHKIESNAI